MQQTFSEETYLTIIISTVLLLFFGVLLVYYFFLQQKKRFQHEQEVLALRESFQHTILQSRLEMQELTLDHIAKELHANFSQLVSLININLSAALPQTEGELRQRIIEAKRLAKQLMADVKILSVSLNSDHMVKTGFRKALDNELQRLERTGSFKVHLIQSGDFHPLPPEREIILFRLCQEILNNIVRHAKATTITVTLAYQPDTLLLSIADDGCGFDPVLAREKSIEKSSTGLMNIAGRAKLVNAQLCIDSESGKGTTVSVAIPLAIAKNKTHEETSN